MSKIGGDPQQMSQMITALSGSVGGETVVEEITEEDLAAMSDEERAVCNIPGYYTLPKYANQPTEFPMHLAPLHPYIQPSTQSNTCDKT